LSFAHCCLSLQTWAQQQEGDEPDVPSFRDQWQQLKQHTAWIWAIEDVRRGIKASGLAWSAGLDAECDEKWPAGVAVGCPCRNCKANKWAV
jgi:hypothetical protein